VSLEGNRVLVIYLLVYEIQIKYLLTSKTLFKTKDLHLIAKNDFMENVYSRPFTQQKNDERIPFSVY
jgi:hypothetical protein